MLKEKLLWERYRPHTMSEIVLLPRIREFLQDGIQTNLIFYSTPGTGKTSLARILASNQPTLEVSASVNTSIDTVRDTITDFVKTLDFEYDPNLMKIVILNEVDRISPQAQDALNTVIEDFEDSVRFILSTNHINKISDALSSRFNKVNFNPLNQTECEFLKEKYNSYLASIISDMGIADLIDSKTTNSVINKFFPDLRSAVQMIAEISITKNVTTINSSASSSYFVDLYNFMLNGKNDTIENYKYCINNFQENPESAFDILGRAFFSFLLETKPDLLNLKKSARIVKTQKEYNETLNQTIDPLVHLLAYIFDLKNIINE